MNYDGILARAHHGARERKIAMNAMCARIRPRLEDIGHAVNFLSTGELGPIMCLEIVEQRCKLISRELTGW